MCDDSYEMLDAVVRERGRLKLKQNEETWQGGSRCGRLIRSSDGRGGEQQQRRQELATDDSKKLRNP